MTGFGAFRSSDDARTVEVEVRSVNNRFFKAQVKVSRNLQGREPELDAILRERLSRGSVTLTVRATEVLDRPSFVLDEAAARSLWESTGKLADDLGTTRPPLESLLSLPGVLTSDDELEGLSDETLEAVKAGVGHAIDALVEMRRVEGEKLATELLVILDRIEGNRAAVAEKAPGVVSVYQEKLEKRVNQLLAQHGDLSLGAEELRREVAIYADRSDISEELQRLGSHLEQFRATITGGGEVGRKLDFMLQEMLRETNTIASKSGDFDVAQLVVDTKSDLERLREQVQNVE